MFELVYPAVPAPVFPRPRAGLSLPPVQPSEEILPLIEPSGLVYGQAARSYCHSGVKVLHPVVHLHLIDRYGRIFLQRRAFDKDLYPGYWDTSVGGHVAYGELVQEALYRETAEELGLTAFHPVFLLSYAYETDRDNEYVVVFGSVGHPNLKPSPVELSDGRWWTFPEVHAAYGKNVLTPNFEQEFARIHPQLLALL